MRYFSVATLSCDANGGFRYNNEIPGEAICITFKQFAILHTILPPALPL